MTLQEKIDKLPLSIIYNCRKYKLFIGMTAGFIRLTYRCHQPIYQEMIIEVYDMVKEKSLSSTLEDVIDKALTIIENKEWEK